MKKKYKVFIIVLTLLVILPVIAQLTIMTANNCIAINVRRDIEEIPLPQKTEQVEALSSAKKLIGNGNGMQYFGAVLLKSELDLEEIDLHYSQYREKEYDCIVEKQTGKEIKATDDELSFKSDINGDDYYIVYSWGNTENQLLYFWDIRGH